MASRATVAKWLAQLTHLPTAPGVEDAVVSWVSSWARRRPDLKVSRDSGGNLFVTQGGRTSVPPVLAVAHMDHPAFVMTGRDGSFQFRGGVDAPYFADAQIRIVSRAEGLTGRIQSYDPESGTGTAHFPGDVEPGDIATWRFPSSPPARPPLFRAPACDDLAGVAAALAALDRARERPHLRHFGLLLTRAEEVGLIGAIHAAREGTIPEGSRLISIETSRELPTARMGHGPIIRIGDRSSIFDQEMSNRISEAVAAAGITHQRKLMDGGGCEATAFGAYGYPATGMCLALGNWHNRGNLDQVENGDVASAIPMLEEISIEDFHGLISILLVAVEAVDSDSSIADRLDRLYESNRHFLN